MRPLFFSVALVIGTATLLGGGAAARDSGDICIEASRVDHTDAPSDNVILFYMKGGKVWKNTLHHACPGLHFEHAFRQEISSDQICANKQVIHVLNRDIPCFLGDFEAVPQRAP
jgi:hypothetical protein